ncbi:serine aminopeptidase domain-containing protein [Arcobacter defluvii]|uniref:Esterase/lipase n=2 Tax=Arcobacter TaxID=28196 RepID=A0AAE7E7Y4_9BACT|nr:alpha/beta hydrolase [Arcobacter defluvii]QKF77978.1 esterase/lipase [Arcobacter defluvii]RXI32753.1 glycerol acyltransferase [Arcobacter defluvii]
MIDKNDLLINTNGYVLSLLQKILDANIEVIGVENIPKENPKMFVANHFTRTEAMLVPYTLYNITNKKVGVIAADSLFKSFLGDFLENLGALKTTAPNRNEHIIGDLITSCKDWMIFPEGMMIKGKDISKIDKNFCVKVDGACQRVHTGAAVFALLSQIFRQKYFDKTLENYEEFSNKYFINKCTDINKNETMIIPINISYSKLRNGKNFLVDMASKLIHDMGVNFKEELEIEGNIVLNSKITIRILEPISTKNLLDKLYKKDLHYEKIINSLRYEVTHNFMDKIYESLTINFDHIFVLVLFLFPKKEIEIEYFKRLIYITIFKIKEKNIFYDEDINKDLIYLISYEKFKPFNDILEVAIKNKILQTDEINCYKYLINKKNLLDTFTHHTIRLKNILRVILNEILIQEESVNIVKNLVSNNEELNTKILLEILKYEEDIEFENSYKKFENHKEIKDIEIGKHKYFENKNSNSCVIAIHGFSSAPKEMEKLAIFLNKNGFNVQTPRLDGHGTVCEDLKNKIWQDWYKSVSRSIIIASLQYKKVFIIGFSTGGLLALLSTKKQYKEFVSLICINAALHLNDMRIKTLLPAISFWNDIVKVFHEDKYAKEYIDNTPENPEINYHKHYVDSIEQLNLLMNKTKKTLPKIKKPILIIQGKDDPVVNPSSAHEIFERISSRYKTLKIIDSKKHVIVTEYNEELFYLILNFIKSE